MITRTLSSPDPSAVETVVLRAHQPSPSRPAPPRTKGTLPTTRVAVALLATRKYGRAELALLPALRRRPTRVLPAIAAPHRHVARGRRALAATLITTLLIAALTTTALLGPRVFDDAREHASTRATPAPHRTHTLPIQPRADTATAPAPAPAPTPVAATPPPSPADAIESLAQARYAEALISYAQLARARPNDPAYAAVAAVLQRKLAAQCAQRAEAGGPPCPAVAP